MAMGLRNKFITCRRSTILITFVTGLSVFFLYEFSSSVLSIRITDHLSATKSYDEQYDEKLLDIPYAGVENYTQYYVAQYGLKSLGQFLPGLGPVINNCTSFQHPINIKSCDNQGSNLNKTTIFIAVISAPGNFEKRNTIRATWKKHLKKDTVVGLMNVAGFAFLMGNTKDVRVQDAIGQENRNHSDIIQLDMVDSYKNLTLKTVSVLDWVVDYCPRVQFVLKVDDDVYVNVRNLAATIGALRPSDKSIYGRLIGGNIPARKNSKWSYSLEMWPWNRLPKYIDGPAYLISGSAVAPLLASAQTTPFFVSEDMYISGICNNKVNVTIHSSSNMLVHNPPEGKPDACFVSKTTMWVSDKYSVSWMDKSHKLVEELYGNNNSCLTGSNSSVSTNFDDPNNFVASTFKLVVNPESV